MRETVKAALGIVAIGLACATCARGAGEIETKQEAHKAAAGAWRSVYGPEYSETLFSSASEKDGVWTVISAPIFGANRDEIAEGIHNDPLLRGTLEDNEEFAWVKFDKKTGIVLAVGRGGSTQIVVDMDAYDAKKRPPE